MRRAAPLTRIAVLTAALIFAAPANAALYVAPHGSDAARGDLAHPFRTIARAAAQARAGDLVVVLPGTYREAVGVTHSGAPQAPIVFRALPGAAMVSPDPARSLSAFDVQPGVAHVAIQGFEISGGYHETVFIRRGAHHITLAGLHIHDNRSGIWVGGAERVVVRDCRIQDQFRNGIRIMAGSRDIEVRDTVVEGSDDGAGCDGDADGISAAASTADVYLDRVEASRNSEDGFDLQGSGTTLLRAVARDNGCSGVKMGGGGTVENLLVENSRVGLSAGGDALLHNLTLAHNALGLRLLGSGYAVTLRNSIVSGPGKAISYAEGVALFEHHNIFYRPDLEHRLIARMGRDADTLFTGHDINRGVWQRESGQGQASFAADPGFAPATCRLSPQSPAVDSGQPAGSPRVDLDGIARPAVAGFDRGAFEWTGDDPSLVLRRSVMIARADGSGRVRIRATVLLAAPLVLNPATDRVAITLRSEGGTVLRFSAGPEERSRMRSSAPSAILRVSSRGHGRATTRFKLRFSGKRAELKLSARGADLWALEGPELYIELNLGPVLVRARAPLSSKGRVTWVGENTGVSAEQ